MYEELAIFELAIWLGLSAWIANATPVLGGGGKQSMGGDFFEMDVAYWVMGRQSEGSSWECFLAHSQV